MPILSHLFLLSAIICSSNNAVVGAAEIGKPHSTVINLKNNNFDEHLQDPANGLWLLKFYAPWCGHCKTLAPVLDAVAPFLAGKMSIGKVDCTVEKKLCKRFDVKGYPTLKYYRDGDFQDYPLGRDKDSIITFGERMSDRAVTTISTYDEAKSKLLNKIPVAYIVYDPAAKSDNEESSSDAIDASGASESEKSIEKLIQSTERTRVFGQVARKLQASGSFGLLMQSDVISQVHDTTDIATSGFIARIEEDVPTKLYSGELTSAGFMEFVKETNLPAVIELGGHNFRFVSRRGKPLAIATYNPGEEKKTDNFRSQVKQYAVNGKYKDDYIFAYMDGIKWEKFLGQFSIEADNLPELFVIDAPKRTYWQDASVFGISEFIDAVRSGEIESREQEKPKSSPLEEFLQVFVDYMPWSLVAMLVLFTSVFCFAIQVDDDGPVHPRPPPRMPKKND